MKILRFVILSSLIIACQPSQGQNSSIINSKTLSNSDDGTSSGGGSCTAEFNCRFTDEQKNSLGLLVVCDEFGLVTYQSGQWINESPLVKKNRWTIYREEEKEYVMLFKTINEPWAQLEVKLERKIVSGLNIESYPATLSGNFIGHEENFNNENMICKRGWFK